LGSLQPTQRITGRDRIPALPGGQRPQPFVRRTASFVARVAVLSHLSPGNPSRQPGLLLVVANASSAKRIGVIRDPELVAIGHNHSHVRLPPVALGSRFRSRSYAGRPRRWARRHLLD